MTEPVAGLTLTLKPREKFLVGGNLVQNGPRRSSIRIADGNVFVLRLSDALHPDEVTTPVRRAYHVVQLILACELSLEEGRSDLLERLGQLAKIFEGTPHDLLLKRICVCAASGRYHGVLTGLKALLPVEDELLGPYDAASRDDAVCVNSGHR